MRLVSLVALASALVFATPTLAAPAAIAPLSFVERTMPNGLRVFAMPDKGTTSVSVQVWYDVGGRDDPKGRSGFAHMFEHLMFKSTRNMPSEQMDRLTEDVGGNNNASTDDDFTEYHEVAPANHLERLLWAESERMGALVVDESTFVSERQVVEEELRGDAARPYDSLFRLDVPAASYSTSSYARSPIGSIADLDAATLDDVRAFHAQYYRPDNAVLVVSGNFDPAQLDRWVDKYFGPIARPVWPIPRTFVAEPPRAVGRRYTLHAPNTPLPAVVLSWQLPPSADPDHAVITVIDGILSGGESSRLYQTLVYQDQIAAETGVQADMRKGAGMFSVYGIVAGGKDPQAVEAALRRQVGLMRDQGVTPEELARARNQVLTSALKERETAEGRASTLAANVILENDPHAADKRLAAIQAVTAADVQRVARRLLADDRAVTITYLPAKDGAPMETVPVAPTVETTALVAPPNVPVVVAAAPAERVQPPAPGAPVTPVLPVPVERHLANGMRLVVIERHALPIVTAYMVADGGSSTDPAGRAGLAGLTADLLTKGTTTRSATDVVREVETLGGAIGADAVRDGMFLSLTVKSDQLAPAMNVFADVAMHPTFKPEELERERAQALDGLKVAYSEPNQLAAMVASRAVYGDGPYGKPADGTPTSLRAIRPADVAAGYRTYWRPDATTLVMAGDITVDQAEGMANTLFGKWARPATPRISPPPAGPAATPHMVVVDMPQTPQASVVVARVAIARSDARYYPMLVADAALGGGFSGRLNQEIRVKRGLAYGAGSSFQARRSPGPLAASTSTKNPTVPDVIDLIRGEMTRMGTDLVAPAELDARKATLVGSFGRQVETTDGLAGFVAGLVLENASPAEIGRYSAGVNSVTPEQVRSVSKELIDPAPASVIVVGDAAQFQGKLQAKGTKAQVIPVAKLNLDNATLQ
jgi:zinc protease